MKYICRKCNYRSSTREGKDLPFRCPYCGTEGTLQHEQSSSDLLDEFTGED
ncbi:hypothetical protein GOV04_02895 [Candidatus Woesearchaeota archaeon]|nr:hypothetical protein [Candidatus Woesearchaeota archaeon]